MLTCKAMNADIIACIPPALPKLVANFDWAIDLEIAQKVPFWFAKKPGARQTRRMAPGYAMRYWLKHTSPTTLASFQSIRVTERFGPSAIQSSPGSAGCPMAPSVENRDLEKEAQEDSEFICEYYSAVKHVKSKCAGTGSEGGMITVNEWEVGMPILGAEKAKLRILML